MANLARKNLFPSFRHSAAQNTFSCPRSPDSHHLFPLLFLEDRDTKLAAALPIARAFTGVVVWVLADFMSNFALSIFGSWQVHKLRTVL